MNLETAKAKLAEQSAEGGAEVKVLFRDRVLRITEIRTENSGRRGQQVWFEAEEE
jgi:hypothetical protein